MVSRKTSSRASHALGGTVAGGVHGIDLHGAVEVVAHGEFGPGALLQAGEGAQRHGIAVLVAHVELTQLFGVGPVFPLGLDVDLPLTAEPIEVIDKIAAHEGLQDPEDLADVHALLEHFVPVHLDEDLGHGGHEGGGDPGEFRPLPGRGQEFLGVFPEKIDIFTGPVFQDEGDAAGSADARDGRGREGKGGALGEFGELLIEGGHNGLVFLLRACAVRARASGSRRKSRCRYW